MKYSAIRTGKAGEYRVASELMKRDLDVFMTIADTGTDIVAMNGCRIQVKAARDTSASDGHATRQIFTFSHDNRAKGQRQALTMQKNDAVVLWAIDHDRFFIVPADLVHKIQTISLTLKVIKGKRKNWVLKWENRWDVILKWSKR